ncbi:2897_t:CDS:2, partial [Entrophospora sp. SA101]
KLGYNTALLNKIPNKSERISAHLKKCSNFKIMHPEKYNEFFGSDETINLNSRDLEQISSSNSSISTKGSLDSFVVCPMWREVYNKAEIMIEKVFNMGANLISIVSDSAPSYAAARCWLRVKHVQITFLPCYAHQMNLFVGEIFKESVEFKATSTDAIK